MNNEIGQMRDQVNGKASPLDKLEMRSYTHFLLPIDEERRSTSLGPTRCAGLRHDIRRMMAVDVSKFHVGGSVRYCSSLISSILHHLPWLSWRKKKLPATARPASQSSTLCPAFRPGRSILGETMDLRLNFCDKNRYAMGQAGLRTCTDTG